MQRKWTYCYRMRPYFRNVGLICTVFFAAIGLASSLAAYFNVDGSFAHPKLTALIFGLFWSAFTCLGIWLLLLYHKYRLFVNDSSLRQIGVVRDSQVEVNLVDELKWRCFPKGGSVRLSGLFGVLKIELGNFNVAEREELVAFFRHSISETRQSGWREFKEQIADTPEKQRRSRRTRIQLAFVCGANAIAFGIVWAVGHGLHYLVLSGVNAAVAAYLIRANSRGQTASAAHAGEQGGDQESPMRRVFKP